MDRLNNSYYKLTSLFHQDGKGSVSCCTSLSTLTVESHPSFMSIFYLLSTGPREIYCYDSFKWKPPRCNYYVTSETTPWRGTTSKPKRKGEKSHAISQSLNIGTIDKPKVQLLLFWVTHSKKKTTLKKTILKRTILEKKPTSVPGGTNPIQYQSWKRA